MNFSSLTRKDSYKKMQDQVENASVYAVCAYLNCFIIKIIPFLAIIKCNNDNKRFKRKMGL